MSELSMMRNEKMVKDFVKKVLKQHSIFHFMPPANGYGAVGIPDILAVYQGRFIAIETKFGKNKLTVNQENFRTKLLDAGALHYVVSEANLDDFVTRIEELVNANNG